MNMVRNTINGIVTKQGKIFVFQDMGVKKFQQEQQIGFYEMRDLGNCFKQIA